MARTNWTGSRRICAGGGVIGARGRSGYEECRHFACDSFLKRSGEHEFDHDVAEMNSQLENGTDDIQTLQFGG